MCKVQMACLRICSKTASDVKDRACFKSCRMATDNSTAWSCTLPNKQGRTEWTAKMAAVAVVCKMHPLGASGECLLAGLDARAAGCDVIENWMHAHTMMNHAQAVLKCIHISITLFQAPRASNTAIRHVQYLIANFNNCTNKLKYMQST
jgi:hypothetical protein